MVNNISTLIMATFGRMEIRACALMNQVLSHPLQDADDYVWSAEVYPGVKIIGNRTRSVTKVWSQRVHPLRAGLHNPLLDILGRAHVPSGS